MTEQAIRAKMNDFTAQVIDGGESGKMSEWRRDGRDARHPGEAK
jgi:hypothetical protein